MLNLIEKRKTSLKGLKISRACISPFYTTVMIENGYVGLCHTPLEDIGYSVQEPKRPFYGTEALNIARLSNSLNMIERTVGIAAFNALSQYVMDIEGREREFGVDASDAIEVSEKNSVAVVGYMKPIVEKLRARARELYVFERNPQLRRDALPDTFVDSMLPKADIVIISGASLTNGTLDRLLELSKEAELVAVVGPTASVLPEPLFERGVDIVAGVHARGSEVLDAVAEARAFKAFKELVKKYIIKSERIKK